MKYLILILNLIAMPAFAESPTYSLLISGPAWHATSEHYNWKTFGVGIARTWSDGSGELSVGIGEYKNSLFHTSEYIGVQKLVRIGKSPFEYGASLGLVNGYPERTKEYLCTDSSYTDCKYMGIKQYGSHIKWNVFLFANLAYTINDNTKITLTLVPPCAFTPAVITAGMQISF